MTSVAPKQMGEVLARLLPGSGIAANPGALSEGVCISPANMGKVLERLKAGGAMGGSGEHWQSRFLKGYTTTIRSQTMRANNRTQEAFSMNGTYCAVIRAGSDAVETIQTTLPASVGSNYWADALGRQYGYYNNQIFTSIDYFKTYKTTVPNMYSGVPFSNVCQLDDNLIVFFQTSYAATTKYHYSFAGFKSIGELARADSLNNWPNDGTLYLCGCQCLDDSIFAVFRGGGSAADGYNLYLFRASGNPAHNLGFVKLNAKMGAAYNPSSFYINKAGGACLMTDWKWPYSTARTMMVLTTDNLDDPNSWKQHIVLAEPSTYSSADNGQHPQVTNSAPFAAVWRPGKNKWDVIARVSSPFTSYVCIEVGHDDGDTVYPAYGIYGYESAPSNEWAALSGAERVIVQMYSSGVLAMELSPGGNKAGDVPAPFDPPPPPVITTTALPSGGQGVAYSFNLQGTVG